jgi:hypothetical protein
MKIYRFPWWVRFLAKALGIAGGFVAIFFGILGLLTLTPSCIIAVILQLYKFSSGDIIPV